jgi:hypothetical protein
VPILQAPARDCTSSGAKGKKLYTQEGFVVLKGSIGRRENVPSIIGTAGERLRQKLLDSGIMRPEGDRVVFERDHLFRSRSMAALAVMGRRSNGCSTGRRRTGARWTRSSAKRPITRNQTRTDASGSVGAR